MANDCFFRVFEKESTNENLPYLGQFDVDYKADTSIGNKKVVITTTAPIDWDCSVNVYDKKSDAGDRQNLGKHGTLPVGTSSLFIDTDAKLLLYPMYGITMIYLGTDALGQADISKLVLNVDTLELIGPVNGKGIYGDFVNLPFDIVQKNTALSPITQQMPISKTLTGYDKYTNEGNNVSLIFECVGSPSYYQGWFLEEYLDEDADLCGILEGTGVSGKLTSVRIGLKNKGVISNIEDFAACTNLTNFTVHSPKSVGGSISEAFKNTISLTNLSIVLPNNATQEIEPLLDGMSTAGRVSSSITIWGQSFTLNGEPLGMNTVIFDFDAQGNWTKRA